MNRLGLILLCFLLIKGVQLTAQSESHAQQELAEIVQSLDKLNDLIDSVKYDQAIIQGNEILDRCLEQLGEQDTITASAHQLLANAYFHQNEGEEALKHYSRALAIRIKNFDNNHPLIAQSHYNLGNVFWNKGDINKAEEQYQKALDMRVIHFGDQHPKVAASLNSVGIIKKNKGDLEGALQLFETALDIYQQHVGANHPKIAETYEHIGLVYQTKGNNDLALSYYQKAETIHEQTLGINHPATAHTYNNIGTIHRFQGAYDQAFDYFEKGLTSRIESLGPTHAKVGDSYLNIGTTYQNLGKYEQALDNILRGLDIHLSSLGEDHLDVSYTYNMLGAVYWGLGDFEQALKQFEHTLRIRLPLLGEDHIEVADCYSNIGLIHNLNGDYWKAIDFFEKDLTARVKVLGPRNLDLAYSYNNLGTAYSRINILDKAKSFYQLALSIRLENLGPEHPYVAFSYNNVGVLHWKSGEFDKALELYTKALNIRISTLGESHPDVAKSYENIGSTYTSKGQFDKGQAFYEKAIDIYLQKLGPRHRTLAVAYNNLAENFVKQNHPEKAMEFYQQALDIFRESFGDSHPHVVDSYNRIGSLYFEIGEEDEAVIWLDKGIDAFDKMKKNFASFDAKQTQIVMNFSIFDHAIRAITSSSETSPQEFDLKQAFYYSEKAKNNLLLESIHASTAKSFAGISSSSLEKEFSLNEEISQIRKLRFEENQKGDQKNDTIMSELNKQLFELNQSYDSLILHFETQYPNYYSLKYKNEVASVEAVQADLPDSSLLVEYFWGENDVYIFAIDKREFKIHSFTLSQEFQQNIDTFLQLCRISSNGREEKVQFAGLAYGLYQTLLEPVLANKQANELIIIPDGKLGYLPFDLLLDHQPETIASYSEFPYLIRGYQIRYEYAATLLLDEAKGATKARSLYAGFAPQYQKSSLLTESDPINRLYPQLRDGFSALFHNQAEVKAAANTWDGQSYVGPEASEENFKSVSKEYRILHLAMHSLLNDSLPLYSGLVFSPNQDTVEDGFLYAYELFNMNLNAELTVLSACETGLGKIQRGEGIMSLARAVKYAGCKNILMSLWKAEDQSTTAIMDAFFSHLKAGRSKDEALREAKLSFLDSAPMSHQHPFYWGTFVLVGEDDPIESSGNNWIWGFVFLFLVGGTLLVWKMNPTS